MKILFITHRFYPHVGGIEVNSEVLATYFHDAGHTVHLVTWTTDTGSKVFPFPVIRQPRLSLLLKEHKWADVVYENNPSLRLSWPALFFNRVSVIALRTWINRKADHAGFADKLKVWWLGRASGVIAISEAVRKQCWPPAIVIGNPYRNQLFRKKDTIARDRDFVFLGRLVSDKGADQAIEAIYLLKKDSKLSFTLTIIGDGPDRALLEEQAKLKQIEEHVHFTGNLHGEELVNCLNRHYYLLVPSNWEEPFGNVALEGMACGCIPIVSDGGGLPDAVGNAGLIFQRGNVNELVACMKKLTGNGELRTLLADNAKAHLQSHEPGEVGKRYLNVITHAVKGTTEP